MTNTNDYLKRPTNKLVNRVATLSKDLEGPIYAHFSEINRAPLQLDDESEKFFRVRCGRSHDRK